MSDIITNTTNTNDCKVFKVYLSKYTATTISSNSVINNSTVNGINVTDALNNLQNSKLDKPTSTGDYYLSKIVVGGVPYDKYRTISLSPGQIPVSRDTYIGASLLYEHVNGKIGLDTQNPSEKLEVNGNIKANSYKFTLPSVLTPQPNMLIAKIDGSGLIWYNNSSIGNDLAFKSDIDNLTNSKLDKGTYTGTASDLKNEIDGKLNKPTTTGNTTSYPYVVGENGNGGSARLPAGDLGKNFFNADLSNTTARNHTMKAAVTINTLGNPYYWKGLSDKTNNTNYSKKLALNPTTGEIVVKDNADPTDVTNAINSATAAQKTTMRTALLGPSTPASPTISGANPSIIAKGVDTYIDLYGLNLTLLDPSFIYIKRADESRINALQFYNLTTNSVRTLWNLPTDLPDGIYQIYIQNGVTVQGASQGYLYVTNKQLTQVNILQNQWIKRLNPQGDGSPAVQNVNGNTFNIALDNYVRLHNTSHNGVYGRSSWKSPNILPTAFTDVWSVEGSMLYSGAGGSGGTIIPFIGVTKTTDAEFLVPSDINILENTFTQLWAEGARYGFVGGNLIYTSTTIPLKIVIEKPVGDKIYMKIIYDAGSTVTIVYQNAVPITPDSNYAIFMNLQPGIYGNMWWSCQFTVKKLI